MTLAIENVRETRVSKVVANKRIVGISEEVIDLEEDDSRTPNNRRNVIKTNINLSKQYEKLIECGSRDLFKIHDPKLNKNDQGSKIDDRLKYVDFRAGLYVAMGSNMVKILKESKLMSNDLFEANQLITRHLLKRPSWVPGGWHIGPSPANHGLTTGASLSLSQFIISF